MGGGKIGRKQFSSVFHQRGITSVSDRKPKLSADRGRTPGFLRIAPINAGQQITELRRGDRHHTVGRARPQKATTLQSLREQARALAVMPDHLQKIAAASTEAKQMPAQRIAPQHFLHLQRQARKALPHIGVAGRQPDPHTLGSGIMAAPAPREPAPAPPRRRHCRRSRDARASARSRSDPVPQSDRTEVAARPQLRLLRHRRLPANRRLR